MTMTREERLAALEKQRRAAAANGSAGRTTSTGRPVTNMREPRLKLPTEYTAAKSADPAIPPRTAKPAATGTRQAAASAGTRQGATSTGARMSAAAAGTRQAAASAGTRQGTAAAGTRQGATSAGTRQRAASAQTPVASVSEASAPKLSREERAEALNRRRAAQGLSTVSTAGRSGAAGGAQTAGRSGAAGSASRAKGTAAKASSARGAATRQRSAQQAPAGAESAAAYEARRQKRRAEWEKRVKRARRRRIMFAAGIIAILALIVAAVLWPKHDPAVFQESKPQTENQQNSGTPGDRVLPGESEDGGENEEPNGEVQGEQPGENPGDAQSEQPGENQGEQQPESEQPQGGEQQPEAQQPQNEQPPVQQAEVQMPVQTPAAGPQDLAAVQARLPEYVNIMHLPINPFSRPYLALKEVTNIVIHYVGNPGTTADANWGYFESLAAQSPDDPTAHHASSNFIVGLDGEIINCIPINEVAYCSNSANWYSLSIEVCHPDAAGQFNDQTYTSLLHLTAWLCENLGLDETCLRRHFDITGKGCPKYYVDHPEAWEQFKADVGAIIRKDRGL